jgi:2,4-dienoyl-CoA reductase-like NADH-dependent reductase (Old Yellow Enzyme family)
MAAGRSDTAAGAGPGAEALFRPFRLKDIELANRIALAPMARHRAVDGVAGPDAAAYYRRRAEAGVGLIITEGVFIDHPSAGDATDNPRMVGAHALAGLGAIAAAVHAAGGRAFCQLWHVGATHANALTPDAAMDQGVRLIGPSGLDGHGRQVAEPMTVAEIEAVVASYGRAAAHAKALGFDGIEIHAGHGYLIDQFLWERTNRRTDAHGGDAARRTRFAVDVLTECRRAVGPDFAISLRISQWKIQDHTARLADTPAGLGVLLEPLAEAGADLFHCSAQRYWLAEFPESPLNLAGWARKLTGRPAMTVGSVGLDRDVMDTGGTARPAGIGPLLEMLGRGDFDLVAVGRALLADPGWVDKIRRGAADELLAFSYAETPSMA